MSKPVQNPDTALIARLAALEAQVKALQQQGQLANAGIRAWLDPTPGANRGLRILDASNRERVRLGIDESGNYGLSASDTGGHEIVRVGQTSAGYGFETMDTAGTARFRAGQITGGAYGAEARDASGNVIWDTSGLIGGAVMTRIGSQATGGSFASPVVTSFANSTAYVDVAGSYTGVATMTRGGVIFFSSMVNCYKMSGASTTDYFVRIAIKDQFGALQYSSPIPGVVDPTVAAVNIALVDMIPVGAGTFNVGLQVAQAVAFTSTTCSMPGFVVNAFRMGA